MINKSLKIGFHLDNTYYVKSKIALLLNLALFFYLSIYSYAFQIKILLYKLYFNKYVLKYTFVKKTVLLSLVKINEIIYARMAFKFQ